MASNYPPGVTGNEYAISGAEREQEEQETCGAANIEIINIKRDSVVQLREVMSKLAPITNFIDPEIKTDAEKLVQVLQERGRIALEAWRQISRALSDLPDGYDMNVCPFEGVVLVEYYQGSRWWDCPLCGTHHDDVIEGYEDDYGDDE